MTTLKRKPAIMFWAAVMLSTVCISLSAAALPPGETDIVAEGIQTSYALQTVQWEKTPDEFILVLKGDTPPTYTMYELFEPLRVTIDIADASISASANLPMKMPGGPISVVEGKILEDKEPFIARIELFLKTDNSYTVERIDNDIVVKFPNQDSGQDSEATEPVSDYEADQAFSYPAPGGLLQKNEQIAEEILAPEIETTSLPIPVEMPMLESDPGAETSATVLLDIQIDHSATETKVFLKADGAIRNYKKVILSKNVEANKPARMYLDVKDVRLANSIETKPVGTALGQIRTGQRTDGFRIVFDSSLDELFDYTITERADGLLVTVREPSAATAVIADLIQDEGALPGAGLAREPEILEPEVETASMFTDIAPQQEADAPVPARQKASGKTKASLPPRNLFAGYTKQRITVDFYKIDLHNVFRLFGEISNLNMVVDQGVSGSLTLALNDVPWDFAMDIILNLKNLQMEEKYNTIVISPKSKQFEWPERSLDKVEFMVDTKIDVDQQKEEGIRIKKMQEVPDTVVEAKKLIHQAQNNEKLGNFTAALPLYESAFAKWPENTIIAKRIAALCLVHLGQNAKAVHYAKEALKANPNDSDSALQAAIGSARMKKNTQAEEFFGMAVGGARPSSEALSSYSAFCEEKQEFDRALALLKQHEDLHGDSLQSMIGKARIHDKQGQRELATAEYRAILLSGYEIPPDLSRYIKGRASLAVQPN